DLLAQASVPGGVALLHEFSQATVLADGRGDLQAAGERVHAADVGVEEVDWLEALAAHFGVEVGATGGQAAHLEDDQHDLRGEVNVGGELVGIPAKEQVAGIGVDAAEGARGGGDFQVV